MYCGHCGQKSSEGDKFCGKCGASLQKETVTLEKESVMQEQPRVEEPQPVRRSTVKSYPYAGFWLRAGAIAIDAGIMVAFALMLSLILTPVKFMVYDDSFVIDAFQNLIIMVVGFLYFALTESSQWQATVGKKAVGLIVTDMNGNRLTFGRASARYWSKVVSGLSCYVGFIMAGFTDKKQGLHDMIAGCLVLKGKTNVTQQKSHEQSF
ncbi:RDD family protein [Priestia megaterium]